MILQTLFVALTISQQFYNNQFEDFIKNIIKVMKLILNIGINMEYLKKII